MRTKLANWIEAALAGLAMLAAAVGLFLDEQVGAIMTVVVVVATFIALAVSKDFRRRF